MNDVVLKINSAIKESKSLIPLSEYPYWNYVTQIFNYTRSYDLALIFCNKLFNEIENRRDQFSENEYSNKLCLIYTYELLNLYKLDLWDDFVTNWDNIFQNVKYGHIYSLSKKSDKEILPYIISETEQSIVVHFLWGIHLKRKAVDRKILKRNCGMKIGNLLHAKQSELTDAEIMERFEWMLNYRTSGVYNFDPPASSQQKRRRGN